MPGRNCAFVETVFRFQTMSDQSFMSRAASASAASSSRPYFGARFFACACRISYPCQFALRALIRVSIVQTFLS